MLAVPISYLEVFLFLCMYAGLVCAVTLVLSFLVFLIQRFMGRKKTPVDAPVKERGDCA